MTIEAGAIWSAIAAAWIAGGFSVGIFILKKGENKKRDKAQFKRDEAHIANLIYPRIKTKIEEKGKDKIEKEVKLYREILRKVRTEVEI